MENYLHIVLANLLVFALVILGMFALIVPGIIIACRLAFVSYIVMDKKLDPIEAVELSWKLTRGHGWQIFFMGFVSIFIVIFGLNPDDRWHISGHYVDHAAHSQLYMNRYFRRKRNRLRQLLRDHLPHIQQSPALFKQSRYMQRLCFFKKSL